MKTTILKYATVLVILTLFSTGCKNKWKQPTDITFSIHHTISSDGSLSGTFNFKTIEFEGKRKQGDDVNFNHDESFTYDFSSSSTSKKLNFELPQGTYKNFHVVLRGEDQMLHLSGKYKPENGHPKSVILDISAPEVFRLQVENNNNTDIVLQKDIKRTLHVEINLDSWFSHIPQQAWENADYEYIQGKPTIQITRNQNAELYSTIQNKIRDSFKAYIE